MPKRRASGKRKGRMQSQKSRGSMNQMSASHLSPAGDASFLHGSNFSRIVNLAVGRSKFIGSDDYVPPEDDGKIYDARGQFAYNKKHRKPKWVTKSELERFNQFENTAFAFENSNDGRIIIENPFIRQPENNRVWSHISEDEVTKYVSTMSYLDRCHLDAIFIRQQPTMVDHSHMYRHFLTSIKDDLVVEQQRLAGEAAEKVGEDFRYYGYKNLGENLKASPNWIPDFRKTLTHREFQHARHVARQPTDITQFCYDECFREKTREWQLCYDPHAFE